MMKPPVPERQLPYGVADLFYEQSAYKSQVEGILKRTFQGWSYSEIIPPTFEYYEPLSVEASPQVREEIYRFFDRDGRMLALRADPTIPIARIVGTKLQDRAMPLRFFYVTNVFRYEEPKAALRREFTQAGIELIAADSPYADAEVIALAVTAMREVGIHDFRLRIGTMGLINSLLDELALSPEKVEAIKLALERKSNSLLSDALNGSVIRPALRDALSVLPILMGGGEVLEAAQTSCAVNPGARSAIDHLSIMHKYVQGMGCSDAITYDLAMLRGMAYYTGIVFEGFAPGIGFSIMSGGRYDNLLSHFGQDLAAMGFAIGVERAMSALAARTNPQIHLNPDIVAELSDQPEMAERAKKAREIGLKLELSLSTRSREDLVAFARRRGAHEVWYSDGRVEGIE